MEQPKILYEETTINFNRMRERHFGTCEEWIDFNFEAFSRVYEGSSVYSFLR